MTRKRKTAIISVSVALTVVAAAALGTWLYFKQDKFDNSKMMVEAYFLNPSTSLLEPEHRYIAKADNSVILNKVFDILYQAPGNTNLAKFPVENVRIEDAQLTSMDERTVLELDFSSEYHDMAELDELFFRAALVWTMTGLDFITDVNIFVGGQKLAKNDGTPIGPLNRDNVLLNPVISPDKVDYQNLVLYFPDNTLSGLYRVERSVLVNPDRDIEKYIVEQLIAGPQQDGLMSTIPAETAIRSVKRDGDTCYVSLNSDFINKHTGGLPVQNITIYSIVNSLTELRYVNKVQFLIEAEKVQDFKGGFDLSKPIERNESLIKE